MENRNITENQKKVRSVEKGLKSNNKMLLAKLLRAKRADFFWKFLGAFVADLVSASRNDGAFALLAIVKQFTNGALELELDQVDVLRHIFQKLFSRARRRGRNVVELFN